MLALLLLAHGEQPLLLDRLRHRNRVLQLRVLLRLPRLDHPVVTHRHRECAPQLLVLSLGLDGADGLGAAGGSRPALARPAPGGAEGEGDPDDCELTRKAVELSWRIPACRGRILSVHELAPGADGTAAAPRSDGGPAHPSPAQGARRARAHLQVLC